MASTTSPPKLPVSDDPSDDPKLTPSDQLFSIFAVNLILVIWVAISFVWGYETSFPHLELWMYILATCILVFSLGLSIFGDLWPRIVRSATGGKKSAAPINPNIVALKITVFFFTILDIVLLWKLAEETGGVISPYAPFLPAPAIFAPFVTRNWGTVAGLSLAVVVAIFMSDKNGTVGLTEVWPYHGSAAVMVLLAGILTVVQVGVEEKGAPLTGKGSDLPAK